MMNNNIKSILSGLFWVLVVCFFAYAVINMTKENSAIEMEALKEIKTNAEKEAIEANKNKDLLLKENSKLSHKIGSLENQMTVYNQNVMGMSKKFEKSFNEIKKYQNEKVFVNDNASLDEQLDFLTKYRYKEY